MSDDTYTLEEARRELARRECQRDGHDWSIIYRFGGVPVEIYCARCGWAGEVTMGEYPS